MFEVMLRTLSILFLVSCSLLVFGQNAAVELSKLNVLYIGVPNPMKISMENHSCEEIIVNASQGEVSKSNNCDYYISVETRGECQLQIIAGTDTVYKRFRVKYIPYPKLTLGGDEILTDNKVGQKGTIIAKGGIVPLLLDCDFEARFNVNSYTLSFFNDTTFYFYEGSSPMFPFDLGEKIDLEGVLIFDNFVLSGPARKKFKFSEKMIFDIGFDKVNLNSCSSSTFYSYYSDNFDTISIYFIADQVAYKRYKMDSNSILIEKYQKDKMLFQHYVVSYGDLINHKFVYANGVVSSEYTLNVAKKPVYYFPKGEEEPDTTYFSNPVKVDDYIEFYENGEVKSNGNYSFILEENNDTTVQYYSYCGPWLEKTIYKTLETKSVKDGLWTYYNEKGKAIRKEWYEDGELVKGKK